jgi:hypothetical protein
MPVWLREERDCAKRHAPLLAKLPGGVDEAHSGFAAIDYRNALEFILHKGLMKRL